MVDLKLTPGEASLLHDILQNVARELRNEIAHTDSREFRTSLKEREALVRSLLERLESVPV